LSSRIGDCKPNDFWGVILNIQFVLNGKNSQVDCEPQETLAEVLRNTLNLNGTKVSCEVQVCGACTVLVDGVPVSACTYLAYEPRGKNVITIEGLEKPDGTLHPLQQAFIDEFAFQCGYCTPGMIMSAKALLDENPKPTREDIIHHMDGNICRCTGYVPIVAAIQRAAEVMAKETKK
jgi:aerobic carbon-monoxide dehydrogenase small subunit